MSDDALAKQIGAFIKHKRLEQNKTQDMISSADINRSTLSLLERGEAFTLPTLIQVLRVLDPLHVLEVFEIKQRISPLAIAKAEKEKRKRASSKIKSVAHKSDWQS